MQHYKHPETGEVRGYEELTDGECFNDTLVAAALADGYVLMLDEEFETFRNPPPTPEQVAATAATASKLAGIEFDGVMCSATMEDQNGLVAVITAYQMSAAMGAKFSPTAFLFANGTKLTLTAENLLKFASVWMPFRQSFFNPA